MPGETLIEMRKNAVREISTAEDKVHYIKRSQLLQPNNKENLI